MCVKQSLPSNETVTKHYGQHTRTHSCMRGHTGKFGKTTMPGLWASRGVKDLGAGKGDARTVKEPATKIASSIFAFALFKHAQSSGFWTFIKHTASQNLGMVVCMWGNLPKSKARHAAYFLGWPANLYRPGKHLPSIEKPLVRGCKSNYQRPGAGLLLFQLGSLPFWGEAGQKDIKEITKISNSI